jgi:uncharacterized protein YprB with RNaseH-like and TPR domain
MSLDAKLQSIHKQIGLQPRAPAAAAAPAFPASALSERLSGDIEWIGSSGSFSVTTRHGLEHSHGIHRFVDLPRVGSSSLAAIARDPELSYADVSRAVFLDTETTGLDMGTGTYVFLVGLGYVDGQDFIVRQYFLDAPGDERAFLQSLGDVLRRFPVLVSFNGKAFDLPLLENRFRFHRWDGPLDDPPHIDLLHASRRLWKRRLESCALSALELEVLSVRRTVADVPGWEIPVRYFRYQRSRDPSVLEGVFYHNLMDILSLATLTVHIDRVVSDPTCGLVDSPIDFFCIGKAHELGGDAELALFCYEEALRRGLNGDTRADCLTRLAAIHKRERRYEASIQAWELLLDEGGRHALIGRVELAKYFEHVERDYVAAIDQVQHALLLAELFDSRWPEANRRDLEHRLARLINRSVRARNWAGARG